MFQTTNQNQSSNINDINQVVFPTIFRCRSMVETHETTPIVSNLLSFLNP